MVNRRACGEVTSRTALACAAYLAR
jgi:hypothetical protein